MLGLGEADVMSTHGQAKSQFCPVWEMSQTMAIWTFCFVTTTKASRKRQWTGKLSEALKSLKNVKPLLLVYGFYLPK